MKRIGTSWRPITFSVIFANITPLCSCTKWQCHTLSPGGYTTWIKHEHHSTMHLQPSDGQHSRSILRKSAPTKTTAHKGMVKSTTTAQTDIVLQKITCRFNNLIYLIICNVCKSQSVQVPSYKYGFSLQFPFLMRRQVRSLIHLAVQTSTRAGG